MSKRINENDLEVKVLKFIRNNQLIEENDKLVLAVSGGPDSLCMLDLLYKFKQANSIKFEFVVAHVNHMIREEAQEDEDFIRKFCEERNIEFFSERFPVEEMAKQSKRGVEETGRKVRYEFFNKILIQMGFNKIAIAHNKNDVVETMIMNLLRGTGISGLKGIEVLHHQYIRPLLDCERTEIEDYCQKNNLNPRIDKTNFENIYTRNKIRNILIPYIQKEFNPNIIETMSRLSKVVQEEEEYMENQIVRIYTEVLVSENLTVEKTNKGQEYKLDKAEIILSLRKFNLQKKVIKSRIILYTITRLMGSSKGIERIHIEDIINLCEKNVGNKFLMPNKFLRVLVKNGQIYFMNNSK